MNDVANKPLFAFYATDPGSAASLGDLSHLRRRGIELMIRKHGRDFRVTGIVAPDPLRIGHHLGDFIRYDFLGFSNIDAVSIALAHLSAVETRKHRQLPSADRPESEKARSCT